MKRNFLLGVFALMLSHPVLAASSYWYGFNLLGSASSYVNSETGYAMRFGQGPKCSPGGVLKHNYAVFGTDVYHSAYENMEVSAHQCTGYFTAAQAGTYYP